MRNDDEWNNITKNFQVKKIKVLANCKLSLQSHKYRSEHWVVVDGSAIVTLGDEKMTISKNESIFIKFCNH